MDQTPLGSKDLDCPLHKKAMVKVCHKCPLWTRVAGVNPNTGDKVDTWSCAIAFLPMLLVENSQQQRQTGAAVESFRNEMVKANGLNTHILIAQMKGTRLIEGVTE